MIFLLFLASLVTIEAILRNDEARKHKNKQAPSLPAYDAAATPAGESILALMNGVEQHGRGVTPTIHTERAETKTPSAAA